MAQGRDDDGWGWFLLLIVAGLALAPRRAGAAVIPSQPPTPTLPPAPPAPPAPAPPAPAPPAAGTPSEPRTPLELSGLGFPGTTKDGYWHAPRDGGKRSHQGLDLLASPGSAIVAPFPGTIRAGATGCAHGVRVFADDNKTVAVFCVYDAAGKPAQGRILVTHGQRVSTGQRIAIVGNEGFFHYGLVVANVYINPLNITGWR